MITLKQLQKAVNAYLELRGDKRLLSIVTHNPSSPVEFELHLCDIYDGPIGTNPFTNKDSIKLYKDGSTMRDRKETNTQTETESSKRPAIEIKEVKGSNEDALKAYFELVQDLNKMDAKPFYARISIIAGALNILQRLGMIDISKMNSLLLDFITKEFEQE